jgi:CHASE3 domain sensor protein
MAEQEVEAAWRAEFGRVQEAEASQSGKVLEDAARVAFRWSGDEAEVRRLQEEHTHHYLRWTFLSTVAVMIVGLIGVGLSFLD